MFVFACHKRQPFATHSFCTKARKSFIAITRAVAGAHADGPLQWTKHDITCARNVVIIRVAVGHSTIVMEM